MRRDKAIEILKLLKKEWSFYAYLFFSPTTFTFLGVFYTAEHLADWAIPLTLLIFLIWGIFFCVIIYKMRGHFFSNEKIYVLDLGGQLLLHLLKAFVLMFPLLMLSSSFLSKLITYDSNTNEVTISNMQYFFVPIQFIVAMWMLAGFSYVIYNGSSIKSIRNSFRALKSTIKPVAILTLIEFVLSGLSQLSQLSLLFQNSEALGAIIAVVPLYLASFLVIFSLIYVSISLPQVEEKL